MDIHDTLVYVGMILTVGISMIVLTSNEKFKNIFFPFKFPTFLSYLVSIFFLTIFQWAIGGGIFFIYNGIL
tara:strand:+ start:735 stop:947 length:213 start_codon:yes stop_codon:yes gene_type:complete